MNKVGRRVHVFILVVWSLLAMVCLPLGAGAQTTGSNSETVTIRVDVTTPARTQVMGTVVAQRQCGSPTLTNLVFMGTINGKLAIAAGSATELWSGNSSAVLDVGEPTDWQMAGIPKPHGFILNVVQTSPGLVAVNGVPFAIDGDLVGPCDGRQTYEVTNAGQGAIHMMLLPRMGEGPFAMHPLVIVAMLVVPGILIVLFSSFLHRRARGQQSQAARQERG